MCDFSLGDSTIIRHGNAIIHIVSKTVDTKETHSRKTAYLTGICARGPHPVCHPLHVCIMFLWCLAARVQCPPYVYRAFYPLCPQDVCLSRICLTLRPPHWMSLVSCLLYVCPSDRPPSRMSSFACLRYVSNLRCAYMTGTCFFHVCYESDQTVCYMCVCGRGKRHRMEMTEC